MSRRQSSRWSSLSAAALALAILFWPVLPSAWAADPQPRRGGTLIVGLTDAPVDINPGIRASVPTLVVGSQVYGTLLRQDPNGDLVPDLAERWEVSKDGLTYTFYLRKNVKWHDGEPFTSADVKFSFLEVSRKFNSVAQTALGMVDSIDTPDPNTVVIHLKYTYAPFPLVAHGDSPHADPAKTPLRRHRS
ncbi:MAG: hypothetical protein IT307_08090 [Chloroflexi bacterium]|nr:hypothetical protein [Chloroflexota bacterium]